MDLTQPHTTEHEAVDAKPEHVPAPLRGSGVAAGGFPVEFEVFALNDTGKWRKFKPEAFLNMKAKYVVYCPFVVKANGRYYCGSDSTWKMLEDKGDARSWLHDLIIDSMKEYVDGWLNMTITELVAI